MNFDTFKKYKNVYQSIPIDVQVPIEHFDPFAIINHFDPKGHNSMIFESTRKHQTIVIINPATTITGHDGQIKIQKQDGITEINNESPIKFLNQLYESHKMPKISQSLPFVNGLFGYFSYDFARYFKDVHIDKVPDKLQLDDFDVFIPNISIIYDHQDKTITLCKPVKNNLNKSAFNLIQNELKSKIQNLITIMKKAVQIKSSLPLSFQNQFNLEEFGQRVKIAKQHIINGDIFQIILSNPYTATSESSLMSVAQKLFNNVDSPYHFYFQHNDYQATGASPETLIKKTNHHLFSYPLAGTRRRGKNQSEDEKFAKELQTNEKELAEHNMLVDLGRNDLGQVSELGTVRVTKLRKLLKFSNVMHLGSKIESIAKNNTSPIDILSATLPAGTLSGAPKLSAMQIINKLEQRKRGIYGGGIGMIDFNGDMDLCIGIRLAYRKKNQLVVHSGAGIVADSIIDQEYHEFKNKSRSIMNTIQEGVTTNDFTN